MEMVLSLETINPKIKDFDEFFFFLLWGTEHRIRCKIDANKCLVNYAVSSRYRCS